MIEVFDDFVANPARVRESALAAGFGTWSPHKGDIGADFYQGVAFWGDHATLFRALHEKVGQVIPSSCFFRITNPAMEHALIHSDREYGEMTAIVYLSPDVAEESGTAFYKHRETGMVMMPPLNELMGDPVLFQKIRAQMLAADDNDWEMIDYVRGTYNRCLVFDAPMIHCRIPKIGFGTTERESRMVWVCHFSKGNINEN